MASEMLYPVMPVYLKAIGFSVIWIGILEGVAEAVAGLSKSYFGAWSDRAGKRLPFVQFGYALSAISKPLMGILTQVWWVFTARTMDRLGKGMRTGARDALLSAEAVKANKGEVFGFHRSMDTFGAVLGPLIALAWLFHHPGNYTPLFLMAFIPGLLAIGLTFLVREKIMPASGKKNISLLEGFRFWKTAGSSYRSVAGGFLFFALFNSTDVLLLLKIKEAGHADHIVIGIYIFYNLVYALLAYPLGRLADRWGLKPVVMAGLIFFIVTYFGFAFATGIWAFVLLFFSYGAYAACTEGVSKAWLTNIVGPGETATAIGTYTGFQSVAALFASSLAGFLWYYGGPEAAFLSTALAALLALAYFRFRV
jgi:MFS family permease